MPDTRHQITPTEYAVLTRCNQVLQDAVQEKQLAEVKVELSLTMLNMSMRLLMDHYGFSAEDTVTLDEVTRELVVQQDS